LGQKRRKGTQKTSAPQEKRSYHNKEKRWKIREMEEPEKTYLDQGLGRRGSGDREERSLPRSWEGVEKKETLYQGGRRVRGIVETPRLRGRKEAH